MRKIVTMSFNSKYFCSGLSLIASIHRESYDTVYEIVVYDLGLTPEEANTISQCEKVRLLKYPEYVYGFFDGYLEPKQFAWKPCVIKDAGQYGDLIFYLDAGTTVLKDLITVFDVINREDILLLRYHQYYNDQWTRPQAFQLMGATKEERRGKQISAGIIGYKVNGRFQQLIDDAFRYSQNKDIVHGDISCHRHDQSIFSVLSIRYQCPFQPIEIFGEERGILSSDQVILVHRGKYCNDTGLRLKTNYRHPVFQIR